MQLENPQVGDQCVVSEAPETQIYSIQSIDFGYAKLVYQQGERMSFAGDMPVNMLMKPSEIQLSNAAGQS